MLEKCPPKIRILEQLTQWMVLFKTDVHARIQQPVWFVYKQCTLDITSISFVHIWVFADGISLFTVDCHYGKVYKTNVMAMKYVSVMCRYSSGFCCNTCRSGIPYYLNCEKGLGTLCSKQSLPLWKVNIFIKSKAVCILYNQHVAICRIWWS